MRRRRTGRRTRHGPGEGCGGRVRDEAGWKTAAGWKPVENLPLPLRAAEPQTYNLQIAAERTKRRVENPLGDRASAGEAGLEWPTLNPGVGYKELSLASEPGHRAAVDEAGLETRRRLKACPTSERRRGEVPQKRRTTLAGRRYEQKLSESTR